MCKGACLHACMCVYMHAWVLHVRVCVCVYFKVTPLVSFAYPLLSVMEVGLLINDIPEAISGVTIGKPFLINEMINSRCSSLAVKFICVIQKP